jgi:hypothetical protein
VLTSAATVLEPSCRLIPTALVQKPANPLKVATALQLLAAAAAMAEAPTMGPTGGPVVEAVAAVETTRTATPPEPHRAAMTPARRSRSYGARRLLRRATTTASPPSLRDFVTSSQRNSSLLESPSTTRSRTLSSGSGATPSPSRTLAATTTPSASTSPSAWTRLPSLGSSC